MKLLLLIFALSWVFLCNVATATPYKLLDKVKPYARLTHLSFDLAKFLTNTEQMTPELPSEAWDGRVAVNVDTQFLKYIIWRNRVHGEAAYRKFTSIGWKYDLGVRLSKKVEIFWHHHSRHTLDIEQPYYYNRISKELERNYYPMEDSIVVRITLVDRK